MSKNWEWQDLTVNGVNSGVMITPVVSVGHSVMMWLLHCFMIVVTLQDRPVRVIKVLLPVTLIMIFLMVVGGLTKRNHWIT